MAHTMSSAPLFFTNMTLVVPAYRRMADESLTPIPLDPARGGDSTLAGFESARQRFYGGDLATRLNLKIFPKLEGMDLWVEGDELAKLLGEALLLLHHVDPDDLSYWSYRLGNVINAIERASAFGENGVVYIG